MLQVFAQELDPVVDSFECNYIGNVGRGGRRRQASLWSQFLRTVAVLRTNNSVEGWDNVFSGSVNNVHPSVRDLALKLQREEASIAALSERLGVGYHLQMPQNKYRLLNARVNILLSRTTRKARAGGRPSRLTADQEQAIVATVRKRNDLRLSEIQQMIADDEETFSGSKFTSPQENMALPESTLAVLTLLREKKTSVQSAINSTTNVLERRSKRTQKESMTALFIPKLPGLIKKFLMEGEVIKDLLYIMEAFDSRALVFSSKGKDLDAITEVFALVLRSCREEETLNQCISTMSSYMSRPNLTAALKRNLELILSENMQTLTSSMIQVMHLPEDQTASNSTFEALGLSLSLLVKLCHQMDLDLISREIFPKLLKLLQTSNLPDDILKNALLCCQAEVMWSYKRSEADKQDASLAMERNWYPLFDICLKLLERQCSFSVGIATFLVMSDLSMLSSLLPQPRRDSSKWTVNVPAHIFAILHQMALEAMEELAAENGKL
ncbi:unnamed protein product [Darwinula stevensoni]|uniref:Cohesin subunit SCC3/SA HEAT-repeats domain-containing protein n=1 Tax=Darwinula stevensoni TaxID=69355 RepID=A0A7R8XFE0_9CRUS|nr:unnamed protein product [Darwinula stevensoni]CAG0895211.1 unnamed protein product [Darwinula stevensoni]